MARRILQTKVKEYLKTRGFHQEVLAELRDERHNHNLKKKILRDNQHLIDYNWYVRPGHFYSPLLAENEDLKDLVDLKNPVRKEVEVPGIHLDKLKQLEFLKQLSKYQKDMPDYSKEGEYRYFFGNDQFGKADGTVLFFMLRHFKPKRIIEVGSGWTSALMLDVNELFPKQTAQLAFIDPYPERLLGRLKRGDKKNCEIIAKKVQAVDPAFFDKLRENDILFIDNSHVSKSGSDVNYLLFEVLPRLRKGVIVHIHDIFYPFEYPEYWLLGEMRNWNEAYTVRAFLIGGELYEIIFWHSYVAAIENKKTEKLIPNMDGLGSSLWLRKVA